jgi:hypothetical protein
LHLGYSAEQIAVYIKAFDYLGKPDDFDGATIVKTLWMFIDLDALLHDYHYGVCNAGVNLKMKWQGLVTC